MKVENIAECNAFDLHQEVIGLEIILVFFRVAVLHRLYCIVFQITCNKIVN